MIYMPDLSYALLDAITLQFPRGTAKLSRHVIGELMVPTGKILACDPVALFEDQPFTRTVAAGRYPVFVTMAFLTFTSGVADFIPHEREAFAAIQFRAETPVRWEMAITADQDLSTLNHPTQEEFFGHGVDAGISGFMDISAVPLLNQQLEHETGINNILRQLENDSKAGRKGTLITLDAASGLNVAMLHSGWGDGDYPAYWGLDHADQPVCLVTVFDVLESLKDNRAPSGDGPSNESDTA